jgi:hydroxylamine reductase
MAAYAHHARRLGKHDPEVAAFMEEALFATMTNVNFDLDSLVNLCLRCGQMNLRVMEMLDSAHTEAFGSPEPATVTEGTRAGPGILVSGHDLLDLHNLLKQVEGTQIRVYTHGEMLPAHMYPHLHQHPNLAGHYGGAWHEQKREFREFPGPILVTTNCIVPPSSHYSGRLFTTRSTAVPEARQFAEDGDFSPLISAAYDCPPCAEEITAESTVGFHHSILLQHADTLLEAFQQGQISQFYLIGGCDGAHRSRDYFTEYAANTPADSFILTLGCGKFRIREQEFGTHLGFPRLLDMGQCNDAYGAIQVACGLAGALNCSVNELPLTMVISWFEQKAVAVLLTLLSLDVKGITLGPNPPAFISDNLFQVLQEQYDLRLTGTAF